ncbi:helix-turn-helix transcriptional regulator [Natronomonas amylolytica]|uniref:helix-turn-helix transcriptional regulator n=1 Tax=Natronomonas amylolytica TaxID=3108498 RepID=UPI003008B37C
MNRRRADTVVGFLVASVLFGGGILSWQAYQQRRALDQSMGSMMDTSMGAMHGPNPLWYVFGTLLIAAVIGGGYLLIREEIAVPDGNNHTESIDLSSTSAEQAQPTDDEDQIAGSPNPEARPNARVLDLLPDDERRILRPVLESPGITQIELRDRSDFSKSKVSQTVSALEERGLLYRERQGRTYRVYPSEDLQQQQSSF